MSKSFRSFTIRGVGPNWAECPSNICQILMIVPFCRQIIHMLSLCVIYNCISEPESAKSKPVCQHATLTEIGRRSNRIWYIISKLDPRTCIPNTPPQIQNTSPDIWFPAIHMWLISPPRPQICAWVISLLFFSPWCLPVSSVWCRDPSESEWVQVILSDSSGSSWVQVRSQWDQAKPSETKWYQVKPSDSKWNKWKPSDTKWIKWLRVRPCGSKWDPSDAQWGQVKHSETKWFERLASGSKCNPMTPVSHPPPPIQFQLALSVMIHAMMPFPVGLRYDRNNTTPICGDDETRRWSLSYQGNVPTHCDIWMAYEPCHPSTVTNWNITEQIRVGLQVSQVQSTIERYRTEQRRIDQKSLKLNSVA